MGLLRRRRLQWGPSAAARRPSTDDIEQARGDRALRLGQLWEVAIWEIALLRSFYLGNILGKSPIEKKAKKK